MNTIQNSKVEPQCELSVLLVEDCVSQHSDFKQTLLHLDYKIADRLSDTDNLLAKRQQVDADILIIKLRLPTDKILKELKLIKQLAPLPVIIIAEQDTASSIQKSIEAGVSTYVVNAIQSHRLKGIISTACERFKELHLSQSELEQTKTQLKNNKLIDKAKGFITQQKNISEQEALLLLKKMAMNNGQSLARVSKNVVEVYELLKQHNV